MQLGEVLRRVPGLNQRFVHYLEAQGYIRPVRVPKRRIARREYTDEDFRIVRDVWAYYRRGLSPQAAYERSRQATPAAAVALFSVPPDRWRSAVGELAEVDRVDEAAIIYGDPDDLVVRVSALDDAEIYQVLTAAIARAGLVGMPKVLRLAPDRGFRRPPDDDGSGRKMLAYVLLKVPAKQIADVLELLETFPGVTEASVVYGETDIITKVEVADQAELDDLVMNRMHGIEAVQSSRTFIAVGGLHWKRRAE